MFRKLFPLSGRLFAWIGVALIAVAPLAVPESALADEGSDCANYCVNVADFSGCMQDCCTNACAGSPDPTTCFNTCMLAQQPKVICDPANCEEADETGNNNLCFLETPNCPFNRKPPVNTNQFCNNRGNAVCRDCRCRKNVGNVDCACR